MYQCPHCGKPLSLPTASPSWQSNTSVSLGCGSLLVIAIIVVFCSGIATSDLESDIKRLQVKIDRLETTIRDLSHDHDDADAIAVEAGAAEGGGEEVVEAQAASAERMKTELR